MTVVGHTDRFASAVAWGSLALLVNLVYLVIEPFLIPIVWLPAALLLALSGSAGRAILLVALGFGIISAADHVIRPMLLSGQARMNGLVIFLSVLGGIAVFGMLGVVLGPVLVVTALGLLSGYVDSRGAPL